MGTGSPDVEVGDDFPLFFLSTSNPVSTPHVYTTTKATSRDMATPKTPAVFRVNRPSHDVFIIATNARQLAIITLSQDKTLPIVLDVVVIVVEEMVDSPVGSPVVAVLTRKLYFYSAAHYKLLSYTKNS